MTHENFKKLLDELEGTGTATLAKKNARYSNSDDALHNFKAGAKIMGGTPAQACWGYLTKHLTALRDMIERNDFSNREDLCEKCQDSINYIRFIWALGNEVENNRSFHDPDADIGDCNNCVYFSMDEESDPCLRCKNTAIPNTLEYDKRPLLFKWSD